MTSCDNYGTRYSGSYCPNCNEELYIYENQMIVDGYDEMISDDFSNKIRIQREQINKNRE